MLHFNRTTEYALLGLAYLAGRQDGRPVSVSEISAHYSIPNVLLAKVMQRLARGGYVRSLRGSAGGYRLEQDPAAVPFLDVLRHLDEAVHLVTCFDEGAKSCAQLERCDIRKPLRALEGAMLRSMASISLADALGLPPRPAETPPRDAGAATA